MAEHQIPDWNEFCLKGVGTAERPIPTIVEGSQADQLIKAVLAKDDLRDLPEVKSASWLTLFHILLSYKDRWSQAGHRIGDKAILESVDFLYFDAKLPLAEIPSRLTKVCKYDRGIIEDLVVELVLT